jgi:autotransporter-associated beta strand protein
MREHAFMQKALRSSALALALLVSALPVSTFAGTYFNLDEELEVDSIFARHVRMQSLIPPIANDNHHTVSTPSATTYVWRTAPSSNDWNIAGNWQGSVAPPSDLVNTDIVYNSSLGSFPNLTSPYSVHSLTFNDGTNGYAFGGSQLTLGTGGLTQNSTYAMLFSNAIALGAAQSWNLGSGTGTLTLAGGLATSGFTLTLNSLGSNNIIDGAITGTGGLTKTGTGTLNLTGASTYRGATSVVQGTLNIADGGSLTYAVNNVVGPGLTVSVGAALAVGNNGSINYAPSMSSAGQNLTFNGSSLNPATGALAAGGTLAARFLYLGNSNGGYAPSRKRAGHSQPPISARSD